MKRKNSLLALLVMLSMIFSTLAPAQAAEHSNDWRSGIDNHFVVMNEPFFNQNIKNNEQFASVNESNSSLLEKSDNTENNVLDSLSSLLPVNNIQQMKNGRFPDVIIDSPNPTPPGYIRVSFTPQHSSGKPDKHHGYLKEKGKDAIDIPIYFDIKDNLTWDEAMNAGFFIPTAICKDLKYSFDKWQPPGQFKTIVTGQQVKALDFKAKYKKGKGDVISDAGDGTPPAGYVKVVFNPTENGRLNDGPLAEPRIFHVKSGLMWGDAKESGLAVPSVSYKDGSKAFKAWTPSLPGDTAAVVGAEYTATYVNNSDVIEDPGTEVPEDGYVRITFDPTAEGKIGDGELGVKKVFDVKDSLTWGDAKAKGVTIPTATYQNTDKVFDKWDKAFPEDSAAIATVNYTAQYKENRDVIEDPDTAEPAVGYVRISFDPTAEGKIGDGELGVKKVFDVKESLTWGDAKTKGMTVPTVSYKDETKAFKDWEPALPSDETKMATKKYIAQFKENRDVIKDPTTPTPEAGYVRITFEPNQSNSGQDKHSGYIKEKGKEAVGVPQLYDVKESLTWKQAQDAGLSIPEAICVDPNYSFDKWTPTFPKDSALVQTKTYKAHYKKGLVDVIEDPGTAEPAVGYVRISFDPTADGKIGDGELGVKKVFDVKESLTWGDAKTKGVSIPTATYQNADKVFDKWDKAFPEDSAAIATANYTAQYKENRDVVEDPGTESPETGYVRITFDPTVEGKIGDGELGVKKVFDVKESLTWGDAKTKGVSIPTATYQNADKVFDKWDKAFPEDSAVVANANYTAQFKDNQDVIEKDPANPGDVELDRVRFTFRKGDHGSLISKKYGKNQSTVILDVKKATAWAKIKDDVPSVIADDNWIHSGWNPALPTNDNTSAEDIAAPRTFTAQYQNSIIEGDDPNSTIPEGYVRVAFWGDKDNPGKERGTLASTKEGSKLNKVNYLHYDVIDGETFAQIPVPKQNANSGYELKDRPHNWNPILFANSKVLSKENNEDRRYEFDSAYRKKDECGGSGKDNKTYGSSETGKAKTKPVLEKEVHYAYMFGYPDKSFGPNQPITRAEVAALFTRLSVKDNEIEEGQARFSDVAADAWYGASVNYLVSQGVLAGYADGTFRPNKAITRAEFAAIASRYGDFEAKDHTFPDVDAAHWARNAINAAASADWIRGYEDGSFRPANLISRAEVVAIVNRMLNRQADFEFINEHLNDPMLNQFSDVADQSYWAYGDVMDATNGRDFERHSNEKERWIRLNGKRF